MVESQAMPLGREDYKYPKGSFYLVVEGRSFFLQQLLYKHSFGANKGGFLFPYIREIPGDPAKTPERQKKKKASNYISLQKAFARCQAVQITALFSF